MYQFWFACGGDKLRLPVNPERLTMSSLGKNETMDVFSLGEATLMGTPPSVTVSFSGFFPESWEGGDVPDPEAAFGMLQGWQARRLPVRFLVTGTGINGFFTIERLDRRDEGGDVGTVYYSILLRRYIKPSMRKITSAAGGTEREDNRVPDGAYTAAEGESLYVIAKKQLGSGERAAEIYALNSYVISDPLSVPAGTVLKMPEG